MFEKNRNYMNLEWRKMEQHHKKRFWKKPKFLIITTFLVVIFIVAFTSLPGFRTSITGNIVNEGTNIDKNYDEGITISADLTVPNLSATENFEKISIQGLPDSIINIGNQKISLPSGKTPIVLENYEGKIDIDETNINLNGKATRILINNVPITSNIEDGKISISGNLNYFSLKIADFSIANLDYITSGKLEIDRNTDIVLDNEQIILKDFNGNLEIKNKHFKINGMFKNLNIKGQREVSFSTLS